MATDPSSKHTKYEDPSDPLYLHHSDQPGAILVTQPLNDENYPTWSRAMTMALNAKNKEGFINGAIKRPESTSIVEYQQWTRCNNLVKSWLLNSVSKDIGASVIYNNVAADILIRLKNFPIRAWGQRWPLALQSLNPSK